MSQIPRAGGSKPLSKSVTTKIPGGGTKTTTTTKIRELQPRTDRSQISGCQPCPSQSIHPPSRTRPSSTIQSAKPRQGAARRAPPKPAMPGHYNLPAEFGPMSRPGKGMIYSSPEGLRNQMEVKVPKDLKYQNIKVCPGAGAKDRSSLPGTGMADMFSGNYNVYGGQSMKPEKSPNSCGLDERMDRKTVEELFNMSSPEVSMVEEQVGHDLLEKSMIYHDDQVFARSQHMQHVDQQKIKTPEGCEPLIQQTYSEKRVERDNVSERVVKNLAITDIDQATGRGTRVTISEQQFNPDYGLSSEGKDVITVKETVSVTRSYTTTAKDIIHEVITPKIDIDPNELALMVEEENQDVENTLKMVPPDLALQEDRYSVKKRLQKLRLNTESMILLEESVVNPAPTADEAMVETPPEALANIMHTVEAGVAPDCAPDQVFHTLFEEKTTEQSVILSSIGPGPLQDIIVPQILSKEIHKEAMSPDLTDLTTIYKNVTDAQDWPPVDIYASVMDDEAKSPKKGIKTRAFKPVQDEEMPWTEEDLEPLVNIVGAEPSEVLDPANVPDLETSGNLETELTHGIEYFVDADPVQYMSRVQLRGTTPPKWFPGYIFALPEFPDIVKLARNPDEVFMSSWKSCQPKIMPDESISILE